MKPPAPLSTWNQQTVTDPPLEVATIFRRHGAEYRKQHPLTPAQRKVMGDIQACRTADLGGHRWHCNDCGYERYVYFSCRNRHCPKCQNITKAQWLAARAAELLPVPYFHNVFTLPHRLNALIAANPRALLDLLFDATRQTLLEFGRDHFGGKLGFTLVLHTWDQQLRAHYHLHAVIAGGALAAAGTAWVPAEKEFLFPVEALSTVFRAKFVAGLRRAYRRGELSFPGTLRSSGTEGGFQALIDGLFAKPWVVYSKRPFDGPHRVFEYLGRYTHRVAISNHRLVSLEDGQVCFHYRDRSDGDQEKTRTLPAEVFISRFLQHVLPDHFMRIRHGGFLANRGRKANVERCRQLLDVTPQAQPEASAKGLREWLLEWTGEDVTRCPECGRPLSRTVIPPRWELAVQSMFISTFDTS